MAINIKPDPDILAEEFGKIFGISGLKPNMILRHWSYEAGQPRGELRIELFKMVEPEVIVEVLNRAQKQETP